jgi:two-component system, chemotaxis family, chemotaxis protein CheY
MAPHILIIDDDPAIRAILTEVLVDEGYIVVTANNGAEGLAAVVGARPDLVLLDMRMPVLDGWDFARAIGERGISLPIVVMTAAQEARQWSQEIGVTWVLAKPFDLDELLQVVEHALKHGPPA